YKKVELDYGSIIPTEESPTKEGHTFSGWSEIPEVMPANDVTITGRFTANVYTVTYILDDEVFKTEEVTFGTAVPTPEVPAREGYNFSGWGEVPATMPAEDLTFRGSYFINKDLKYNLIYLVDGVEYERVVLSFGDAIVLEASPTKEGHTFSGWSEVPATMPLHDVTVSGTFTANSYRLTYVLDGETFKTEQVTYGTSISTPEAPSKEGYTFSGWTDVPTTMPAHDVTVTGSYSINSYTLLYIIGGVEYKKVELDYGSIIPTEESPMKEGHTFSGWSEIPEVMPANDVTITGRFTANVYTVTYLVDGEVYATEEVVYGEPIVLIEYPTKEGYTFSGWSEVPESMPAYDIEIAGNFELNLIKVLESERKVDVYTLEGVRIKIQLPVQDIFKELQRGIYLIEGQKVVVK
ncbi:MAG: InlB B-repeat-containing protein, partial [Bacteroidaceae bacterium]|nr:InlB B-repeat-containing protein [Bacteroidaceae bacterium]